MLSPGRRRFRIARPKKPRLEGEEEPRAETSHVPFCGWFLFATPCRIWVQRWSQSVVFAEILNGQNHQMKLKVTGISPYKSDLECGLQSLNAQYSNCTVHDAQYSHDYNICSHCMYLLKTI